MKEDNTLSEEELRATLSGLKINLDQVIAKCMNVNELKISE